jgi:diphosphomevalonate decarboxylase
VNKIKATAIAHPNIALIKYWGKRNDELKIPTVSSISVTLDNLYTKTTVEFNEKFEEDKFSLNDKTVTGGVVLKRVIELLDLIRKHSKKNQFAKVVSENNFPDAAGLASSSSAFAALTMAGCNAIGYGINKKEMSIIARQGSGSACRSIFGGFVEWKKGKKDDGTDSFAEQIADEKHWEDFRIIVLIVNPKEKKIKSTEGMKISVNSSELYEAWIKASENDAGKIKQYLLEKNLTETGKIAEQNCLRMHSVMISSDPSLIYWNPETVTLIDKIQAMQSNGLDLHFTIDAGPNIKIICQEKDVEKILNCLEQAPFIHDFVVCSPGKGAEIVDDHLF